MTNREKYKEIEERANKFLDFCNSKKGCTGCPIDSGIHLDIGIPPAVKCAYAWEELEAKEELKPCPFCGGTPTVNSTLVSTDGWESRDIVMCNTCGIQFHGQNAIEKWNRRSES